jgi:type VI secretion system protein VasD
MRRVGGIASAQRWLALALVATAVAGCSWGPRRDVVIQADTGPVLNRNDQGQSLSVVLRIYQLRDAGAFSRASFDALAKRDKETLGADLVDRREVVLVPGAVFKDTQALGDPTRFVGVMALFRRPDERMWRYVFERKDFARAGLALRLEECHIRVLTGRPHGLDGAPDALTPECREEPARTPARPVPAAPVPAAPVRR